MLLDIAWAEFPQAMSIRKTICMVLEALSIGCAVPRPDFDAAVHSLFPSALNLRPSSGIELLTLVSSAGADLPRGIRVGTPENFSFEIFHVGEQVTCRDNILRIGSLTIELRHARTWKCDLPALHMDLANPLVGSAWKSAWSALNQRQIRSNAEIIARDLFHADGKTRSGLSEKISVAMRSLLDAAAHLNSAALSSICSLIGLGAGLTPAGDDLLVGFLGGLWCSVQDNPERLQFVSNLGEAVLQHSHLTNDISRTYLNCAAQGQISSLLADLAAAISLGENSDRLLNVLETAMCVGHTSGMDAVTGLLIGIAAWEGVRFLFA